MALMLELGLPRWGVGCQQSGPCSPHCMAHRTPFWPSFEVGSVFFFNVLLCCVAVAHRWIHQMLLCCVAVAHRWIHQMLRGGEFKRTSDSYLDLVRAPYCYVLHGVKYIDLVSPAPPCQASMPVPALSQHLANPSVPALSLDTPPGTKLFVPAEVRRLPAKWPLNFHILPLV